MARDSKANKFTKVFTEMPLAHQAVSIVSGVLGVALAIAAKQPIIALIGFVPAVALFSWHSGRVEYNTKDTEESEHGGFVLTKDQQIYGTDELAKREERETMWTSGTIEEVTENIVGRDLDDPNIYYTLDPNKKWPKEIGNGTPVLKNNNVIVFGMPGAGKGIGYVSSLIMQLVRRENNSAVIADSKGEAYARFSWLFRAAGIETKMIEFNPHIMAHSDSINIMAGVYDEMKAIDFVNTIMTNTGSKDGEADSDFWGKSEKNLLLAAVLYVMNDPSHTRGRTIADIYNSLNTTDTETYQTMLGDTSAAASVFKNQKEGPASDTQTGLNIRLSLLGNKVIQRIISDDDVSFVELGQRPMVYFVSMSDHTSSMKFLQALFFTLIIGTLTDFADYETGEVKKLPCRVTFLLDEFRNLGRIPDFERIIATSRGRNIDFSIILQDLNQLQNMYPNGTWESVLNCFTTWILLSTSTKTTAEYFAWRAGIGTALEYSYSYKENPVKHKFDKRFDEVKVSVKAVKAEVAPAGRLLRMKPDEIFVATAGFNCCFLKRLVYWEHPFVKALLQTNSSYHVSGWNLKLLQQVARGETDPQFLFDEYGIDYKKWLELIQKDRDDYEEACRRYEEFMDTWDGVETGKRGQYSAYGEETVDDSDLYDDDFDE